MKLKLTRCLLLIALAVILTASAVYTPLQASAAAQNYGSYTDIAKIYNYGSCPGMQGLAVGSQMLYTIKINSDDSQAIMYMTDKDTGTTTQLINGDTGSYYFTGLSHANDMGVWGIDGSSHIFVGSTEKGSSSIVRYRRSGSYLYKVGSYRLTHNGSDICVTAMDIRSVSNGKINFITKWGLDVYIGSVDSSLTSATVEMTKICTMVKSQAYVNGTFYDFSNFVNQGFGYHDGMIFLPISGDDYNLNKSVILVYNIEDFLNGAAYDYVYPVEHLSFLVTDTTYSALFEMESCDICSDGKLYFNSNRRKTNSDTNHDGVSVIDNYTFTKTKSEVTHYTARYNANGGTGSMADTRVPYGYSTPLRTNTFTRSGYTFAGWTAYRTTQDQWYYTDGTNSAWYKEGEQPEGYTKAVYKDGVTVAKTTAVDNDVVIFYAQWTPVASTYTIKYNANGGTGTMADTTVVYGYSTNIRKNTFTRPGYEFVGWTAYRTTQAQWYYTNGTSYGWYAEGSQPSGYVKDIYTDGTSVAKTTAVDGDIVYFYAQWEKVNCSHSYTSKVTTAATCTSTGVRTYTCSSCGDTYTESIASTGHSYTSKVTSATCTSSGYTTYTCSGCGNTYTGNNVSATGHSYTSKVTSATCTTGGYTTYTCSKCGDSYTGNAVAAPGHNYVSSVTAPTCTTDGYTTYTCIVCGNSYIADTISASGHNYSGASCTICGGANPNYVPEYYLFGYINGANYACEEDYANIGMYKFVNGKLTVQFDSDSYVGVKSADNQNWYMTNGWQGSATSVVLYNTRTDISADKLYIPGGAQVELTLTDNGGDTFVLSYKIVSCSHPSHNTNGICTKCGKTVSHSYTSSVTAPTCTAAGFTTYTCGICGNSYVSNPVSAKGHSYVNGYCTVCGTKDPNYATVQQPTLTLSYPSLSFEDEILYNVYYTAENTSSVVEMGLATYAYKNTNGTVANAVDVIPGYVSDGTTYMAQTHGIPAKNLGDAVYFKVYAKLTDGSYVYSDIAGYHAVAYAKSVLNNSGSSAKAKALVVAMLNYGAAAQEYFGYNTDSLMNAILTPDQQALISEYSSSMVADVVKASSTKVGSFVMNGGYSNIYPTVSFEGAFSINYYFTPTNAVNGSMTFYYWDSATYNSVSVLTASNATGKITMKQDGSDWGAAVEGIAAKSVDETIYVAAVYTSNGVSYPTNVIAYSLGQYCKTIAANGEAFGAATAVYGYYAKAFFS